VDFLLATVETTWPTWGCGAAAVPGVGDPDKDIHLVYQTPRRSVHGRMAIYEPCSFIQSQRQHTVHRSFAAGSFLLAGGEAGKRFGAAARPGMMTTAPGRFPGQASDFEIHAREIPSNKNFIFPAEKKPSNGNPRPPTGVPGLLARDTDRDRFICASGVGLLRFESTRSDRRHCLSNAGLIPLQSNRAGLFGPNSAAACGYAACI